jgi:peptidoglycan/LPS O-acetylase OafA/YrhL
VRSLVAIGSKAGLRFSTASSIYLDVIRFTAAVGIAVAHLTQPFFSVGWPLLVDKAKAGLVALFLLSGMVIRYVTVMRKGEAADFVVDRVSRVYSVVLPALLFTIIASYIAQAVNPGFYDPHWGVNMDRPILRIFLNLIFFSQSWNWTFAPLSNEPFWTLSYEVFYYAMYGVLIYATGARRWIFFLILCVLAGQHILLLLPLWLFGCLLHDLYQRLRVTTVSAMRLHLAFLGVGIVSFVAAPLVVRMVIAAKNVVTRVFLAHHHQPVNLHWAYVYYAIGIPMGFVLLWSMLLLDRLKMNDKTGFVKSIRTLSEATFPIYLLHFPMFVLIAALFPYDRHNSWFKLGMLAFVLVVSVLLAKPTNHFKNYLRDVMHKRFMPERTLRTAKRASASI